MAIQGIQAQHRTVIPSDFIRDALQHVSDTAIASDVRYLESFGTRYAEFAHRLTVAEWIRQRFADVGISDADTMGFVEQTHYTWQRNVVATLPGTSAGNEELVIGAHYDSQSSNILFAPGADDNASGVAGIIEIARILRLVEYQPRATIRFVAFAAEELGLHGGHDYAEKAFISGQNILLMQNYDMIGYRNQAESDRNVAINEYQTALEEADLMSSLMQTYTTLTPHKTSANITRSDSWPFVLRFFKAVFVIEDENDFNPRYHSPSDSSSYLDFAYAAEIIQSAIALTLTIDGRITDISDETNVGPEDWKLGQNFPNPFNPSTEIRYTIPVNARVRVWVHSILGEEIAELDNRERSAGTHTVRWVPNMPSGVYYYTIAAVSEEEGWAPFRETKKMLLIR